MGTESITAQSAPSSEEYVPVEEVKPKPGWRRTYEEVRFLFTTREGLIGDYDYK
jgi:hypothetical protein